MSIEEVTPLDYPEVPNYGLAKFELSDYPGLKGGNFFEMAPTLSRYLEREIPAEDWPAVREHLTEWGRTVANELDDLIVDAHKEGKYGQLQKYDRHGNRIDEIIYCAEQLEARKVAWDAGIVNLDFHPDWNRPYYYEHREGAAYLLNMDGEGGIACPLAMTEGMIEVLREVGTEEQKKKYLPLVTDPKNKSHFMAGQYLTERVGGSNVGANRTTARPHPTKEGKWLLTGEKWFCSNPGDIWVTTARVGNGNTIGAFLVTRFKEDGELNGHHILRLKDIIGSRGKVTAEIEYREVEAEMIGRPHTGLALIMRHVIAVSRIHTGLGACAGARRGFMEARAYTRFREAFGKKINQYPSINRSLAQMQVLLTAMEWTIFNNWSLRKKGDESTHIITPLMKYTGSYQSTKIGRAAILVLGGNGIIGDYSVLPRLLNDSIINETWEGTHNIIAGHTIKALGRRKSRNDFFRNLKARQELMAGDPELTAPAEWLAKEIDQLEKIAPKEISEANRLPLCDRLFAAQAVSLLAEEAVLAAKEKNAPERSFYLACAQGLLELTLHGWDGFLPDDSVFLRPESLEVLVNHGEPASHRKTG